MFQSFLRRSYPAALALGAALFSAAAQAQITYNYTFPQIPTHTVTQWDGSTAPTGGNPLYDPPLIRYNDDPAVSVLPPVSLVTATGLAQTPYRSRNFTVTSGGVYAVTLSGTLTNTSATQATIYKDSFDAANPLKNILALIPGATTGTPRTINVNLAPGNYVIVVNSVFNGVSGSFTATITQTAAPAIATIFGSDVPPGASPQFNRPIANGNLPPVTAQYGSNYSYQADSFTVPKDDLYEIYSDEPSYQGQIALYQNGFDPANPLSNCLLVSGDSSLFGSPTGNSVLIANLKAGTQYTLVTSNLANGATQNHTYNNTVSPVTVPTLDSWSGTTVGAPTFNRPVQPGVSANTVIPSVLSGVNVAYSAHTYNSNTSGIATITSVCVAPNSWNNFLVVYQGKFDPSNPLKNAIAAVEGGYNDVIFQNYIVQGTFNSVASLRLSLAAGQTYTIVTTGSASTNVGSYTASVTSDPVPGSAVASFDGTLGGVLLGPGTGYRQPYAKYDANSNLITPTQISANAIAYHADSFTVPTSGSYTIADTATTPAQWGLYLVLYHDAFDPNNPLSNVMIAVPSDNVKANITLNLTAGVTYYAVTGGFGPLAYGDYALSVLQNISGATPFVFSDTLNGGTGNTFTRPSVPTTPNTIPTTLSTTKNDYYDARTFTVPTSGVYNIDAVSNLTGTDPFGKWDDLVVLYNGPFNPASPLSNAIAANDAVHLFGSDAGFRNISLTAGTQYTLVVTGSTFAQFGTYHASVYTGGGEYPPIIPDNSATGLAATNNVTDTFTVLGLNSVTITGLYHPRAGDLLATLSHGGVSIELTDRVNRTTATATGSSALFFGDYTFAPNGSDLGAAATGTPAGGIDFTQTYLPFLNGTVGQSSMLTGDFTAFNGQSVAGNWTLTVADRNAGSVGYFSGFQFNVAANTGTLTGNIALEGVLDLFATSPYAPLGTFHIGLRAPGSFTELRGYDVTLNTSAGSANGSYTIPYIPTGTYDALIKGSKNLAVLVSNITVTTGETAAIADVTLPAADANNDNAVDTSDFGLLVGGYNGDATIPGSGYDPVADFNFDGAVDPSDFGLLVGEYNNVGAN